MRADVGRTREWADEDVSARGVGCSRRARWSTADRLVKLLSYVAAANIAGQPLVVAAISADARIDWDDFVEPTWARRLALYSNVPAVATALSPGVWTAGAGEAAAVERDLLHDLGYEFRFAPAGVGFYRVRPDEHWDARVMRFVHRFDREVGDDTPAPTV